MGGVKGTGFRLCVCVSTFRYTHLFVRIRWKFDKWNEQKSLVENSFDLHGQNYRLKGKGSQQIRQ